MKRIIVLLISCLAILAALRPTFAFDASVGAPPRRGEAPAQQGQDEAIRLSSDLVVVPVSVTDASGQPVSGLKIEDFQLEEDDQRQRIISLGDPGMHALELALLFDVSGSLRDRFPFAQQAALRFLEAVLGPKDTVAVYAIGRAPRIVRPRTLDRQAAGAGILTLEPTKEPTAFYDAVQWAARDLAGGATSGGRRVLIAISDGQDNSSMRAGLSDSLRSLQQADCIFYSINPSDGSSPLNKVALQGQQGMETLASQTGGTAFLPDRAADLAKVFQKVAVELRSQYLLGYYSNHTLQASSFRRIRVSVPRQPGLLVRSRQGYYPAKS
ncbi:MAG: VWA domain-containing protein [Acidobacteria bacterium]|nr:VWA domain-containing protein [Acidobacteriota bacterium]